MRKEVDISLDKLVTYNLLLFGPLALTVVLSYFISLKVSPLLNISTRTGVEILMILFSLIIFTLFIPYIRHRESVKGVRFALLAALLIGFSLSLPSAIVKQDFSILLSMLTYLGSYILLTFIFCPEVLGMATNINEWFEKKRQLIIFLVYSSIVLFYVMGFGWMYYEIALYDTSAFTTYNVKGIPTYPTMVYYSIVTFASLGYGDISPVSSGARLLVSIHAFLGMVINVLFIAILFVFISNAISAAEKIETRKVEEIEKEVIKEEYKIEAQEKKIERAQKNFENRMRPMSGYNSKNDLIVGKKSNHKLKPDPNKVIDL